MPLLDIYSVELPGQVFCFYPIEIPTQEGDAYFFVAKDVVSEYIINTGVEQGREIDNLLSQLALLMQHEEFLAGKQALFVIVLHKYQEHEEALQDLVGRYGGSVVFDDRYLTQHMVDVIEHIYRSMSDNE